MRFLQWLQSSRRSGSESPAPAGHDGPGVGSALHQVPSGARGALSVMRPVEVLAHTGAQELVRRLPVLMGYPDSVMSRDVLPVIDAVADWVQCLPQEDGSGESSDAPLVVAALSAASRCLVVRRGRMLPPGAEPEAMAEDTHRWTCAVFIGALLRVVARGVLARAVLYTDAQGREAIWRPVAGSLAAHGAVRYRVAGRLPPPRDGDLSAYLPLLMFGRIVPIRTVGWLARSDTVIVQLLAFLGGRSSLRDNAIHAIVSQVMGDDADEAKQDEDSEVASRGPDDEAAAANAPVQARSHNVLPRRSGKPANGKFLEDFEQDRPGANPPDGRRRRGPEEGRSERVR